MTRTQQLAAAKAKVNNARRGASPSQAEAISPPSPKPGDAIAYYDSSRGVYWTRNAKMDWIQFTESSMKRRLRYERYGDEESKELQLWKIDKDMLAMQTECDVCYAGPIAGYKAGIHEICGQRILVTDGPKLLKWREGPWPTIRAFLEGLLGEHAPILYGWLKCALRTLYAGPPFRPGQMLAVAGPAGCGKSLLQNLLTESLGGRSAKPYRYLVGDTSFNSDLLRAEHLMVEDDASSTDHRSRKSFGVMLKNLIVNETQSLHRKGRDAILVTPFTRITITLNDEPENLMVLPPMEESLKDKVILLRAQRATFPYDADDIAARNEYRRQLSQEMPAFINFVRNFRIPDRYKNQRYGMSSYHDPSLLKDLMELAPEWKLLGLIDSLYLWEPEATEWEGTAAELEERLRSKDRTGIVRDLLSFSTACGVFLKAISVSMPSRVSSRRVHGGQRIWTVRKAV